MNNGVCEKSTNHGSPFKELFKRYDKNPILTSDDWPYQVNTVFNPGVTLFQNKVLLLARVEDRRGFSHFTKAISENGVTGWKIDSSPTLMPEPEKHPEEMWGIEDPRITWIEELKSWAIVYTSFSGGGPLVSMALTKDFTNFKKIGPIMPPEDKDAALFPRRFNGKWLLLHRPINTKHVPSADILLSRSDNLKYWGDHTLLIKCRKGSFWDSRRVGVCAQPLETKDGWLILYHGVKQTVSGGIYRLGLALLDLNDPSKVLNRSSEWVFSPSMPYEREGDVGNVVFSCGWILDKKTNVVKMYYGCADTCISLATADLNDLLDYIKKCPKC